MELIYEVENTLKERKQPICIYSKVSPNAQPTDPKWWVTWRHIRTFAQTLSAVLLAQPFLLLLVSNYKLNAGPHLLNCFVKVWILFLRLPCAATTKCADVRWQRSMIHFVRTTNWWKSVHELFHPFSINRCPSSTSTVYRIKLSAMNLIHLVSDLKRKLHTTFRCLSHSCEKKLLVSRRRATQRENETKWLWFIKWRSKPNFH